MKINRAMGVQNDEADPRTQGQKMKIFSCLAYAMNKDRERIESKRFSAASEQTAPASDLWAEAACRP
jgi:hypothetical protein